MKDFLLKIVSAVVDQPEAIEITETSEEGMTIYTILAPAEEVGKIIGRGGKVVNSIRTLCRVKGLKGNQRVLIKVEAKPA